MTFRPTLRVLLIRILLLRRNLRQSALCRICWMCSNREGYQWIIG